MSKVVTAIDKSGSFRVYLTISTDLVEEARKLHDTTPLATAGLGRVLTGAGLMGLLLKNENLSAKSKKLIAIIAAVCFVGVGLLP